MKDIDDSATKDINDKKTKYISYIRVSTTQQGRSGLGLEAQRNAVSMYMKTVNGDFITEYQDIESGRHNERKGLKEAINHCRLTNSILCVAKLDRLSRNAAFIFALRDSGIRFVACDNPTANELTVGILAVLAEQEARMISQRTKDALQAAKARGQKLGGFREGAFGDRRGNGAIETIKRNADARANLILPYIKQYQAEGLSLRGIAKKLEDNGIKTARGGHWSATAISRIIERTENK